MVLPLLAGRREMGATGSFPLAASPHLRAYPDAFQAHITPVDGFSRLDS
jgi:hypothetical protein